MSAISGFMDRFGLTVDVALVAIMFLALFGSMVTPALYTVGMGAIAVMAAFTSVQVLDIMRRD